MVRSDRVAFLYQVFSKSYGGNPVINLPDLTWQERHFEVIGEAKEAC